MNVDIRPDPAKAGFFIITPRGCIDSDTHGNFRDRIDSALAKTTRGIIIDMKNVDYVSSAGLGVFFTVKKLLAKNGGELLFCNLKPQIKRLFEVVKALPRESIFGSLEEADQYFYKIMNEEIERRNEEKNTL